MGIGTQFVTMFCTMSELPLIFVAFIGILLRYALFVPNQTCDCIPVCSSSLTLLLLVPFSYKLMHHLKPFAIVVLNGEITVYSVDSPNGFEW